MSLYSSIGHDKLQKASWAPGLGVLNHPNTASKNLFSECQEEVGGMTENRYMVIWNNFRNHTCSQEEPMYEDTLQELMPAQESHRTPCSVQTAWKGAAAPVRRELHYSFRQKAGLVVLIIC